MTDQMYENRFERWYNFHFDRLKQTFLDENPEDFPTDEDGQEIEKHAGFQEWCEKCYAELLSGYSDD